MISLRIGLRLKKETMANYRKTIKKVALYTVSAIRQFFKLLYHDGIYIYSKKKVQVGASEKYSQCTSPALTFFKAEFSFTPISFFFCFIVNRPHVSFLLLIVAQKIQNFLPLKNSASSKNYPVLLRLLIVTIVITR